MGLFSKLFGGKKSEKESIQSSEENKNPNNDAKFDKMATEQYPGKWELLDISSENAHGQEESYNCAAKIAQAAELVNFPILIGVDIPVAVSTSGSMWQIRIRVGWPYGQNMSNVMEVANIKHFNLGRLDVRQNTENNYSEVLSCCTALDWKGRQMKKVWRCNYNKKNIANTVSIPKTFEEYSRQIDELIALFETEAYKYGTDKCRMAQVKFVQSLTTNWKSGDANALLSLQKIIRRDVNTHNTGKEEFQKLVLQEMASTPQLSIEPLLSMIRDQDGNLAFPKDSLTYLYYPSKILRTLKEIALNGIEIKKLTYEFIRIGTKLKIGIPNYYNLRDDQCGVALSGIRKTFYNDNEVELLASIPQLDDDEKKYLIDHNYKIII